LTEPNRKKAQKLMPRARPSYWQWWRWRWCVANLQQKKIIGKWLFSFDFFSGHFQLNLFQFWNTRWKNGSKKVFNQNSIIILFFPLFSPVPVPEHGFFIISHYVFDTCFVGGDINSKDTEGWRAVELFFLGKPQMALLVINID
jgi:hypothetical protein